MNTLKVNIARKDRGIDYCVDLSKCKYEHQVREAFKSALELSGYTNEFINTVFNIQGDFSIRERIVNDSSTSINNNR